MSERWRVGYRPVGKATQPVTWIDDIPFLSFSDADDIKKRCQANDLAHTWVVGIPKQDAPADIAP